MSFKPTYELNIFELYIFNIKLLILLMYKCAWKIIVFNNPMQYDYRVTVIYSNTKVKTIYST